MRSFFRLTRSTAASGQRNRCPCRFLDYNALQINYNHRISHGLTAMISYTYSKFLDNVEGNQSWSYNGNSGPANNYNLAAEKSVDGWRHSSCPRGKLHLSIAGWPWESLRFGHESHWPNAILGGWEISGIATFKTGIPISISGNDINTFGGNPRPDYTGMPMSPIRLFKNGSIPGPSVSPSWLSMAVTLGAMLLASSQICADRTTRTGIPRSEKNWNFAESMRTPVPFRDL